LLKGSFAQWIIETKLLPAFERHFLSRFADSWTLDHDTLASEDQTATRGAPSLSLLGATLGMRWAAQGLLLLFQHLLEGQHPLANHECLKVVPHHLDEGQMVAIILRSG